MLVELIENLFLINVALGVPLTICKAVGSQLTSVFDLRNGMESVISCGINSRTKGS